MGKSSPPPAPDYAAAAQQTAAGNAQQARIAQFGSMTNQVTPYGSINYTPTTVAYTDTSGNQISADEYNRIKAANANLKRGQKPTDLSGYQPLNQWTQTVNMTPAEQAMFNQNQAINQQLGNVAQSGIGYVQNAMANPLQANKITSNIDNTAQNMTSGVSLPSLQSSIGDAGDIATQIGQAGDIQRGAYNNAGDIQTQTGAYQRARGFVPQNAGQIQTSVQDPNLLLQDTTNALYKANTQYLDPQFAQSQAKLENQLANQGITRGSEAYNNAMLNFNNQKQQAYDSARNQAVAGGMNAAQGMFGMNLQGGQFANQALGQQYSQMLQGGQFANQAALQNNQNALANQAAYNQALAQQYNQTMGAGNFANQSQAQQFQQNQAMQQAQNAAQAQQFNQNQAAAEFANQAALQGFGAGQQNAALNNAMQAQIFGQNLSNANLQNQAAAQQLAQNQALQQNPINMLNAVRTGQQMQVAQMPQVGVSSPAGLQAVAGPDLLSAAQATGQYNQNAVNAKNAANASMWNSIIGAGGMMGAAMLSDIRLKTNIRRIGTHKTLGIGLYLWDYLWGEKGAGVMAQELEQVMPEAVITMPDGYKAVNYAMVG